MGGEKDDEGKNKSGKGKNKNRMQKENMYTFLSASAILQKVTIRFVESVCSSARPHGTTRLLLDGFS
jgi:hypothetical protein